MTLAVNDLLDKNDVHVCLLPPNTTELIDLSVNKPAKNFFFRQKIQEYSRPSLIQTPLLR